MSKKTADKLNLAAVLPAFNRCPAFNICIHHRQTTYISDIPFSGKLAQIVSRFHVLISKLVFASHP